MQLSPPPRNDYHWKSLTSHLSHSSWHPICDSIAAIASASSLARARGGRARVFPLGAAAVVPPSSAYGVAGKEESP